MSHEYLHTEHKKQSLFTEAVGLFISTNPVESSHIIFFYNTRNVEHIVNLYQKAFDLSTPMYIYFFRFHNEK